jgi:hypothetical protein
MSSFRAVVILHQLSAVVRLRILDAGLSKRLKVSATSIDCRVANFLKREEGGMA